jgi:hypothetical protein
MISSDTPEMKRYKFQADSNESGPSRKANQTGIGGASLKDRPMRKTNAQLRHQDSLERATKQDSFSNLPQVREESVEEFWWEQGLLSFAIELLLFEDTNNCACLFVYVYVYVFPRSIWKGRFAKALLTYDR